MSRARIEQDADLVMSCGGKERRPDEAESTSEIVKLKLAKHRNGPTGEAVLWFKKRQTRFVSAAEEGRYTAPTYN